MSSERSASHGGRRRPHATARMMLLLVVLLAASCGTRLTQHEIAIRAGSTGGSGGTAGTAGAAGVGSGGSASTATGTPGAVPGKATGAGGATTVTAAGIEAGAKGAAAPAKAAPIIIGTVANLSGPAGAAQRPGVLAVQAWVQAINARGGINGHPIVHIVRDDGSDPARNAAAVQDLVENRGVIAFVGNFVSQSGQGAAAYLAKRGIPVVGGDATTSLWYQNPMFFPQTVDNGKTQGAALKTLASLIGGRNLGTLVCQEAQVCAEGETAFNQAAAAAGWSVKYNGKGSLVQPDYTANCLAARSAHVDVLGIVFDGPSTKRIARSCSDQGFKPRYVLAAVDTTYASPDFEGSVLAGLVFPFVGSGLPAAAEFEKTMARYAPNEPLGVVTATGWTAAKLFEAVAQGVGATPTTADILNGLYALKGETLGGLTVPLTFHRGAPATPVPCAFMMVISGGRFTAPNGAKPTC